MSLITIYLLLYLYYIPNFVYFDFKNIYYNALRYHKEILINASDTEALKEEVARINKEQKIYNLEKFGLSLGVGSLVIVIQVSL